MKRGMSLCREYEWSEDVKTPRHILNRQRKERERKKARADREVKS
jgi:hypothetical protein